MRMNLRHVRYAFMRTADILIGFIILLVLLAVLERRTFEDLLWAAGVALVVWIAFFVYWLWRTQKEKADHPRPGEWS